MTGHYTLDTICTGCGGPFGEVTRRRCEKCEGVVEKYPQEVYEFIRKRKLKLLPPRKTGDSYTISYTPDELDAAVKELMKRKITRWAIFAVIVIVAFWPLLSRAFFGVVGEPI